MEFPSPVDAPPPAYDAQEFDRKISDALDRSLHISQPPSIHTANVGEDDWEEWDEARFEAAARRAHELEERKVGGSSDIAHYRVEKHSLNNPVVQTPGYAYTSVASSSNLEGSGGPRSVPHSSRSPASSRHGPSEAPSYFPDLSHEEEYPEEPLPPFEPVGPSLEGPPFEEVVRQPPRFAPSQADSPPESPLDDGYDIFSAQASNRRYYEQDRYHYPARQPSSSTLRPISLAVSPGPPPMRFDPTVAYTSSQPLPLVGNQPRQPVDAAALYNSAVSSLMKSQRQLPPIPPPPRPRSPTMSVGGYNRPSMYGGYLHPQSDSATYGQRQSNSFSSSQSNPYLQRASSSPLLPHSASYQYQENVPATPGFAFRQTAVSPPPATPQWRPSTQNNIYGERYGR